MKAPRRLLEDQSANQEVRAALCDMVRAESRYDTEAGLACFEASLAAVSSSELPSVGPGRLTGTLLKPSAAALAGVAVIGAAWYLSATRSDTVAVSAHAPAQLAREQTPVVESSTNVANEQPAVRQPELAAPIAVRDSVANVAQPQKHTTPRKTVAPNEISGVLRARTLLHHDSRAALALLAELDRDFPHGVLREERDALTAIARWNAGDIALARQLARSFLAQYPRSAMRDRLREFEAP
jgi:hypothetical protein